LAIKGISRDVNSLTIIQEAILCKIFRCLPSELRKEDWKDLESFQIVYETIAEKNPFFMI